MRTHKTNMLYGEARRLFLEMLRQGGMAVIGCLTHRGSLSEMSYLHHVLRVPGTVQSSHQRSAT